MTEIFRLMKTSPYFTVCCEVGNCIVTRNNDRGYLCGYCAVPISLVERIDTEKFAGTVPVHGGVTRAGSTGSSGLMPLIAAMKTSRPCGIRQ